MAGLLEVRSRYTGGEKLVFKALDSPLERLKGLLGTGPDAQAVALMGCSSVHTVGMRYRIDIAFVGWDGAVLEVWQSVPPGRLLSNRQAWVTLERPHRRGVWLARGEQVEMMRVPFTKRDAATAGTLQRAWRRGPGMLAVPDCDP